MLFILIILTWFVGSVAAYRSTAFIHEIVHQRNKQDFLYFTTYWHLTSGVFALLSEYEFTDHLKHHKPGVFGTKQDKQYPLIRSNILLAFGLFFLLPLLMPLQRLINSLFFFIKLLIGNCYSDKQNDLYSYRLAFTVTFLCFSLQYPNLFIIWYCLSVGGWYLSMLRVPLEHELKDYKSTTTILDQVIDSKDYKRSLFSFIIQPLGLNYHQLHHRFPGVPYHNLHSLALEESN